MKNLQAVILAAGKGERMWPLISSKALLSFVGKPIISYIIDDLKQAGIKKIMVVGNKYNLAGLKEIIVDNDLEIEFYTQIDLSAGMAGGFSSIPNFGHNPTIVVNSHDLLDLSAYIKFIKLIKTDFPDLAVSGIYKKDYFPGGYLVFDKNKVVGMVEKPGEEKKPSDFVNLVLHFFKDPEIMIKAISQAQSGKDDVYEVALNKLLGSNLKTEFFHYDGLWQSLKYPWQVLDMMTIILQNRFTNFISPKALIDSRASIKGKVIIQEGVKILPGACVVGPCFIGRNTVLGNNSLVRESMIGQNCVVGYSTEVARSWIDQDCWFHKNYIGDSVIAKNVSFGSGAVLANLRLDEKNVLVETKNSGKIDSGRVKLGAVIGPNTRLGVNSSIMPGILIGQNSAVGPGLVLDRNLDEKMSCLGKNPLSFKELEKQTQILRKQLTNC